MLSLSAKRAYDHSLFQSCAIASGLACDGAFSISDLVRPPGRFRSSTIQCQIESILHLFAELVTGIGKKDFCVLAAMLAKALARSETNRTKFIELPLDRAAAHVATKEAITSAF